MPTRNYSLKQGEPKRLEITSSASLKNTTVRLDGKTIGSVRTKQELEAGKSFPLGDGSVVNVHLLGNAWSGRRIGVERDGRPLPGSPSDPSRNLRVASNVVFFIAGVNLLVGVLGIVASTAASQSQATDTFSQSQSAGSLGLGIGLVSLFGGLLYLALGFFVRRGSKIALGIAVTVFALNLVVSVIVLVTGANLIGCAGVPLGIALLTVMSRGFGAIDAMRVEEDTIQPQGNPEREPPPPPKTSQPILPGEEQTPGLMKDIPVIHPICSYEQCQKPVAVTCEQCGQRYCADHIRRIAPRHYRCSNCLGAPALVQPAAESPGEQPLAAPLNEAPTLAERDTSQAVDLNALPQAGQTFDFGSVSLTQQQVTDQLQASQTFDFGPFSLSAQGVSYRTETLPWNQVGRVRMVEGYLSITKVGGFTFAPQVTLDAVPKRELFLALMENLSGQRVWVNDSGSTQAPAVVLPPLSRRVSLGGAGLVGVVLLGLALTGLLSGSDWAAGSTRVGTAALLGAGALGMWYLWRYRRGARARRTLLLTVLNMALLLGVGFTGLGLQDTLHEAQGQALFKEQRFPQALQEYQAADDIQSQATVLLAWGKHFYAQQQYDQATQKFKQALQLHPPSDLANQIMVAEERAFADWGTQLYAQQHYADALDKFLQAYNTGVNTDQVSETLAHVHEDYGTQLLAQGHYEQAVNNFSAVLSLTNDSSLRTQAKNQLVQTFDAWGTQLELSGDFANAADKFKDELSYATTSDQIQQAREHIATASLLWGDQYLSKSDFQDAITTFETILNDPQDYGNTAAYPHLHREDAKAYFGLLKQQEAAGDYSDARATAQTLIHKFSDTPQAQQARAELSKPQNVTGRIVVYGSGKPAAHVRLYLSAHWSFDSILGSFTGASDDYTTVSDANGNFTFHNIPPGSTVYLISYIGQDGRQTITVEQYTFGPEFPANTVTVQTLCPTDAGIVDQF